jgi:putative holliday junction resolvase
MQTRFGRIVSLDFGMVRIGVAISDERQIIARPLSTLQNKPRFHQTLQELLQQERVWGSVIKIVVGLPLKLSGKDSAMTEAARKFAEALGKDLPLPVELWDERLTSALVERLLSDAGVSRKKRALLSDSLSAVAILQSYLDRREVSKGAL